MDSFRLFDVSLFFSLMNFFVLLSFYLFSFVLFSIILSAPLPRFLSLLMNLYFSFILSLFTSRLFWHLLTLVFCYIFFSHPLFFISALLNLSLISCNLPSSSPLSFFVSFCLLSFPYVLLFSSIFSLPLSSLHFLTLLFNSPFFFSLQFFSLLFS